MWIPHLKIKTNSTISVCQSKAGLFRRLLQLDSVRFSTRIYIHTHTIGSGPPGVQCNKIERRSLGAEPIESSPEDGHQQWSGSRVPFRCLLLHWSILAPPFDSSWPCLSATKQWTNFMTHLTLNDAKPCYSIANLNIASRKRQLYFKQTQWLNLTKNLVINEVDRVWTTLKSDWKNHANSNLMILVNGLNTWNLSSYNWCHIDSFLHLHQLKATLQDIFAMLLEEMLFSKCTLPNEFQFTWVKILKLYTLLFGLNHSPKHTMKPPIFLLFKLLLFLLVVCCFCTNFASLLSFNPYHALGVPKSASIPEIKHAYKNLARK